MTLLHALSEGGEHYSRGEFLRLTLSGALTLVAGGFGSRALAQVPPTYSDLNEELRKRDLHIQSGEVLPGNDDFREFLIMKRGGVFARLITLEAAGDGYFDQVICDGDKPTDFVSLARQYETGHPNTEVVLQVAGGFSCQGQGCQTTNPSIWEPDGAVFHRGQPVGWDAPNPRYGGVVLLGPNGTPRVLSHAEFDRSRIGNGDAFQAYTLVEQGLPQSFRAGPAVPRRALIERYFTDGSGAIQNQWAILNVDAPMDLSEFGEFLVKCLGVRNAALLDTGDYALGWLKYQNRPPLHLLTPHPDESTMPNFTSLLVGIRRK